MAMNSEFKITKSTHENLLRKAIAKDPNNCEAWKLLFLLLIKDFNFQEIIFLTKKAFTLCPAHTDLQKICFHASLHALNIDWANYLIGSKELKDSINSDEILSHQLYYLSLVNSLKNKHSIFQPSDLHEDFEKFNSWVFNSAAPLAIDVIFLLSQPFHFSIQSGIANCLKDLGLNCIFTNQLWVALYLSPHSLITSESLYSNYGFAKAFIPNCLFVNTRHGIADKNYAAVGASASDRVCVSSDSISKLFINNLHIDESKIWVTGFPQMDTFFQSLDKASARVSKNKTVLFAPTYNQDLSCLHLIKDKSLTKLIRGENQEIEIIIKPHPLIGRDDPSLLRQWELESKTHPNVKLINEPSSNLYNIFSDSDLMVTDMSSAGLAWMATGKPIINLIDPDSLPKSERFAKDGLEWQYLSSSVVINKATDLNGAVLKSLERPFENAENRKKYSDFLFGNLRDGKASERIARLVLNYIKTKR